ncbi:hypothetical protein ACFLX1_01885, partial [Chloroflexota bacterium]
DLLILDIAIPAKIDEDVKKDAGIELLREISERDIYKMPLNILCVTALSDVYSKEEQYMSDNLITFLYCDPASDSWCDQIVQYTRRAVEAKNALNSSPHDYYSFLAVVCALESPELAAVLNNGWDWVKVVCGNDATVYHKSEISIDDHIQICYASAAPRKGMPAAAVLATKMVSLFRPKYLSMVGITSGYKDKIRMGDVIVADPVWDWGSGKLVNREGKTTFEPEPHQLDLEIDIRNKLKMMTQDTSVLASIKASWPGDRPSNELSMIIGPLASGAVVLADEMTRQQILEHHRGLLGIGMETYAIFAAAQESAMPRPTVFTMKSVVDFADYEKDDRYQYYAAYTSAQVLAHFVQTYLV